MKLKYMLWYCIQALFAQSSHKILSNINLRKITFLRFQNFTETWSFCYGIKIPAYKAGACGETSSALYISIFFQGVLILLF